SLYLPNKKQKWYDFFTGESYQGGLTFADLPASLWKLPIFIKKGSILPFTKASNHPNEITYDRRQFAIYPSEEPTTFTVFEDDGISMGYEKNAFATTKIHQIKTDTIQLTIEATKGNYPGMITERETRIYVFSKQPVKNVRINGQESDNWTYESIALPKFTKENSASHFANQQLSPGRFVRISVEKQSVFEKMTIEINRK